MKKILLLSITFFAIALLPQSVLAQEEKKEVTKEVNVEEKAHKRANVVPVRKNTKQEAQKATNQTQKAVKKSVEKKEERPVEKRTQVMVQKDGTVKEVEMLVRPFEVKKKKKLKKDKPTATEY